MATQESPQATENFAGHRGPADNATQSSAPTSRDLLFARLAVHTGFVEPETIDEALRQRTTNAFKSLADILVQSGALSEKSRQAIDLLLEAHLAMHSNDPQQSLSSLPGQPTDVQGPHPDDTVAFIPKLNGATSVNKRFGDYELLGEIARGGMGVVYKARQGKLNRLVALKMIRSGELADEEQVKRFYSEAEAAAKLDHPGIVPVYEVGEANGQHFFSMALVAGTSLNDRVKNDGPLPPKEAARLLKTVVEAVDYAHGKGIIHRDIKPQNILLDEAGQPRLTDFGLAKQVKVQSDLTATGQMMGTPSYMPPEQASGKLDEIGPASDVYSLGATLYFLLTGRPPFQTASTVETIQQVLDAEPVALRRLNPSIPRDLETICLKCLRKEPSKRYATAGELAADLRNWLESKPIVARPVGPTERIWLWCKRRPTLVGMSLLLVVLAVGGTLAATLIATEQRTAARVAGLVDALVSANTSSVPEVYAELAPYRRRATPLLQAKLAAEQEDSKVKLHTSLALVSQDSSQVEYLSNRLLQAPVEEVPVIIEFLRPFAADLNARLWEEIKNGSRDQRIRAAATLAAFDPGNAAWQQAAPDVAAALVSALPVESKQWIKLLAPACNFLAEPLAIRFRDRSSERDAERPLAAMALGDYWRDELDKLTELVLLADNRQEFRPLLESLRPHRPLVSAEHKRLIAAPPPNVRLGDAAQVAALEAYWKRQSTAAVCLMELGEQADVWPLLKDSPDPSMRSMLIERLAGLGATFDTLAKRLDDDQEVDASIRQAVVLALGDFDLGQRSVEQKQQIVNRLAAMYRDDPDSGIHSAAAWTLRRWHQVSSIKSADTQLQTTTDKSDMKRRKWFVNSQGQTFLVVPGPVEFVTGEKRETTDALPVVKLSHGFAVGTTEVTMEQFLRFRPAHEFQHERYAPDIACPALEVSWYDAVAYCNWLSELEGLGRDQWCYTPNDNGSYASGMAIPADFLQRTGYRLPTEAEWECVCRAGTSTRFSFGESEDSLARYGWYDQNSRGRAWPVGAQRPNLWGAQDMHANAWEWCQEPYKQKSVSGAQAINDEEIRVLRGGSFLKGSAQLARSAYRHASPPTDRSFFYGFRVARTTFPLERHEQGRGQSIQAAVQLKNLKLLNVTPTAGDTLNFSYDVVNSSGQVIQLPPGEKFVGTRQHWIERLGDEPDISAESMNVARKGRRYAASGFGIDELGSTIAVGMSTSFVQKHEAQGYPPGQYRFYVEFADGSHNVLQTEHIEFKLAPREPDEASP